MAICRKKIAAKTKKKLDFFIFFKNDRFALFFADSDSAHQD
jgi:hypothetical protein